jgi:hypothetical protein
MAGDFRAQTSDDDLPFADPDDVLLLKDSLFSADDLISWAEKPIPVRPASLPRLAVRNPPPVRDVSPPRPPRRTLRYQLKRKFDATGVHVAPAARATARFSAEESSIHLADSALFDRWPEVLTSIAALGFAVWLIMKL